MMPFYGSTWTNGLHENEGEWGKEKGERDERGEERRETREGEKGTTRKAFALGLVPFAFFNEDGTMKWSRREWISSAAMAAFGAHPKTRTLIADSAKGAAKPKLPLALKDFEPRSMLHVPEAKVERARFPV